MTYQLTITFDTFEALQEYCSPKKESPKKASRKKPAPVEEIKHEIEAPVVEPTPKDITITDLADATNNLMESKGRDITVAVLDTFGAKRARDLQPEQYADYIAATQEALAA